MSKNEKYPIFKHWYSCLNWLLDICDKIPRSARYTVARRVVDMSLEVQELIIEAIYTRKRRILLLRMNLILEKLRIMMRLCHDRRYISTKQYRYISTQINEAGKMTGGWLKSSPE